MFQFEHSCAAGFEDGFNQGFSLIKRYPIAVALILSFGSIRSVLPEYDLKAATDAEYLLRWYGFSECPYFRFTTQP
jgi:hypothetical protein